MTHLDREDHVMTAEYPLGKRCTTNLGPLTSPFLCIISVTTNIQMPLPTSHAHKTIPLSEQSLPWQSSESAISQSEYVLTRGGGTQLCSPKTLLVGTVARCAKSWTWACEIPCWMTAGMGNLCLHNHPRRSGFVLVNGIGDPFYNCFTVTQKLNQCSLHNSGRMDCGNQG